MLSKLAVRNARRSMRDYLIYILTMIMITAIMFAFNSMIFSESVRSLCVQAPTMIIMLGVASAFIVWIIAWLVSYMVRFMASKRSREFAVYMLLGFQKKQIANLFMKENILIGLISFAAGLIPGIFCQQLLTTLIYAIVSEQYTLHIELNIFTFILTAGIYILCYLLALMKNRRRFKKMNIRELLYADRENEKQAGTNRAGKQWMFFAGIGYIIIFIWMMYRGNINIKNIFILLAALAASVYVLFIGLSAFLTGYIRRSGTLLFRNMNLFVFRQLASKVRTMQKTLGTLTLLFTAVLTGCSCALMLNQYQNTQSAEKWPFDVAVYREDPDAGFEQEIRMMKEETDVQDLYVYQIRQDGSSQMNEWLEENLPGAWEGAYFKYDTFLSLSDYNRLRTMLGYDTVSLKENEYLIQTKERIADTVARFGEKHMIDSPEGKLTYSGIHTEPFEQNGHNGADYIFVVPDACAQKMTPYYSLLTAQIKGSVPEDLEKRLLSLQGINAYDFDAEMPEFTDRGTGSDTIYSSDSPVYVSENSTRDMRFLLSSIIFPLFYIAIVFVCVAMTILAVQQISDSDRYRYRYRVLGKLGLSERELDRVVFRQLSVYYLCPFAAAVLISFGMVWYISRNFLLYSGIHASVGSYFVWSVLFLGMLYLIYFALTFEEFRRNIRKNKYRN